MKKQLSYKEIADLVGKSENTIKGWKQKFPILLELVKTGAYCKENDLDIERINKLVQLQETIRGSE